jgi:hypothetical protein
MTARYERYTRGVLVAALLLVLALASYSLVGPLVSFILYCMAVSSAITASVVSV